MNDLPVSDDVIRGHFDPGYLATVSPAALNQWLQGLHGRLKSRQGGELVAVRVDEPTMVVGIISGAGGSGPQAGWGSPSAGTLPRTKLAGARCWRTPSTGSPCPTSPQ